ncbi:MAG: YlxR family protein [Actinobacteria bacterium]|nr:YlxR family protein [Actinomycetota bacterium]
MVERSCCGCRVRREQHQLVRFCRTADGSVVLDGTGTLGGRGSYVCRSVSCLSAALKRAALARSLRAKISEEQAADLTDEFVRYLGVVDGEHQSS